MKILFAGPSLHRDLPFLRKHCADIQCAGPARCSDIASAVEEGASALALVDGLFAESAAPWHKEILFALSRGVRVAGGASMGALRAAECRAFGMVGIGTIFAHYATDALTDDGDVAQIHAPAELNYLPLTEPWVNIAPTLHKLGGHMALPPGALDALRRTARQLHYTERTYAAIVHQCDLLSPTQAAAVLDWLQDNAVDQKRVDALACLDWLQVQPDQQTPAGPSWTFAATTHFLHLLAAVRNPDN